LTAKENTNLWKRVGQIAESKLENLIKTPEYQTLDDEEKSKIVDKFVSQSKVVARAEVVIEQTQGLTGTKLKEMLSKLKAGGIMVKEVYNKWLDLGGEDQMKTIVQ
jgi:hypothetical protein